MEVPVNKILKCPGVLRKGFKDVPFAKDVPPSYASLSDELALQSREPAKSSSAKKAHQLLEQLSFYRLDPTIVPTLLRFFEGHDDYHVLRSALYALDELATTITLDKATLSWVTKELNHEWNARRVHALRLLASLELPKSALKSVQKALLSILSTIRGQLERQKKEEGKDYSVSIALLSAAMAACAIHLPQEPQLLPFAISSALSPDATCARNGLAVLVQQSLSRPVELAAQFEPYLPRQGHKCAIVLGDHVASTHLLNMCYNVVVHEQVTASVQNAFFEALAYLALSAGNKDGVVLQALNALAQCGWDRCSAANVTRQMIATLSGILAPPSRKPPARAILHAALGAAIAFGRSWTVYAAATQAVTAVQAGPFSALQPAVLLAATSGSAPLRLRALQALLWTSLSPDEWVVTRDMCRQQLAANVASSFIDDLVGSLLRRAELLPLLASASLKFTVECVITVPASTNVDLVLSVLETWVMRHGKSEMVLRCVMRILDLPYTPENAEGIRRVHKGLYWFLGEFCTQLEPNGWKANHAERSIAAQAMTAHLQQGASFGDWETRSVCLAALVKLAILFDDPLRICVHAFLSDFANIEGMAAAHPIIRSVLLLFDKIYTVKAELHSRINKDGMQWSHQELAKLAGNHALLTELSKPFCPRLPKPYFPLGTHSEGLIALAAQVGRAAGR